MKILLLRFHLQAPFILSDFHPSKPIREPNNKSKILTNILCTNFYVYHTQMMFAIQKKPQ